MHNQILARIIGIKQIVNPEGKSKGIKEVVIDGKHASSNLIPVFGDGAEHRVKLVIG